MSINTPVGTIYTTTALKDFQTLTGLTPEQFLVGLNDISIGNGAKITFANLIASMISADNKNILAVGSDNLLSAMADEVNFDDLANTAKVIFGETEYGGTIVTNLNTITKSGFYTSAETGIGVPTSATSWFVIHQNSNEGTAAATQRAVAYNSAPIVYDRTKIGGTWGEWVLAGSGSGGGVVIFDPLGTVSSNITIAENKITTGHWSGTNSVTIPTVTDIAKQISCVLDFTTAASSQPTITNTNLKWSDKNGGKPPSSYSILSGVQNLLVFKSVWIGGNLYWEVEYTTYGGVETAWVQPLLTSNGTLGTGELAVSVSAPDEANGWKMFDGVNSTWWDPGPNDGIVTFSTAKAIKIASMTFAADLSTAVIGHGSYYGSNDGGTTWTLVNTFTGNTSLTYVFNINSNENYTYHKLYLYKYSTYLHPNVSNMSATYIAQ